MKLSLRFLLLMTAIFCGFIILTWLLSTQLMTRVNEKWGEQFVQRQVMFDKYRTLSPLIREISLAKQMANDPDIIQMALHEDDPVIRQKGIAAMESYRFNFRDHSYFAAISSSGNYYYNDAANQFKEKQLRYVLSPNNANDKWFFATLAEGKAYQVNLDPDVHLGVTKVWINVLIKQGEKTLGLVGTGIDLTDFLKETVSIAQHSVHNFFIDKSMAIQLHDDPKLIDYMGIAKDVTQRIKVDRLFNKPAEIAELGSLLRKLEQKPNQIMTMWVVFEGEKHLLGIAYLPEIGWYDLTLMETSSLALVEAKYMVPIMFGAVFLIVWIVMGLALRSWVLQPIAALQRSTDKIQHGDFNIETPHLNGGEIALLANSFSNMAGYVRDVNQDLEDKVSARTDELNRITEYEKFRSQVLELMAEATELPQILEAIVRGIERLHPSMICSVLLLDSEGKHLGEGVAPSLPDFYNAAIDGVEIGMGVGSCGTAAFTKKRVVVSDISTHPYWAPYKALAASAGLASCWSEPIVSSLDHVLGTFAIYHQQVTEPTETDIAIISETARLASIAIQRKRLEEELYQHAFRDPLTKLPNRRLLNDRLDQTLDASRRNGHFVALMFLDLDNFKPLNDEHGHGVGDLLLIEVAKRIRSCVRGADTVARFGGDEFVVMLRELSDDAVASAAQASTVAEKIRVVLSEPYLLMLAKVGREGIPIVHRCTSSIGVVIFDYTASREQALQWADVAMYQAKSAGRNCVVMDQQIHVGNHSSSLLHLNWRELYECGEPTIDQDHRKLFELANHLFDAAFTRDEDPKNFDSALDEIFVHIIKHFKDEEAILASKHYEDLDNHILAHKILLAHAQKLRAVVAAGGDTIAELVGFVANEVVAQHMLKIDHQFYSLFERPAQPHHENMLSGHITV